MIKKTILIITICLLACIVLIGESQPAKANQPDLPEERGWSSFQYVNVAGSAFRPRASATTWAYPGSGCIYISAGSELLTVDLQLPQGSRIDYLRLFFYDQSAYDGRAWITTYNGAGGLTDRATVTTSGTPGYGTTLSTYVGHVVDNTHKSYVLNFRPSVIGNMMRLCGMRVAYRMPIMNNVYLPLVVR